MGAKALAMALGIAVLGGAQGAAAGVTYAVSFRTTDVFGDVIPDSLVRDGPGAGTTDEFGFLFFGNCNSSTGAGCPVMDVLVFSTDSLQFISTAVGFQSSVPNLQVLDAVEWTGIGVGMMAAPAGLFVPIAPGVTINNMIGQVAGFDATTLPPVGPPSAVAGTYNIGTIVWDTSQAGLGSTVVSFIRMGIDATGVIVPPASANIIDITGTSQEVRSGGFIELGVIPEPATAVLLGVGLAALTLVRRRRGA